MFKMFITWLKLEVENKEVWNIVLFARDKNCSVHYYWYMDDSKKISEEFVMNRTKSKTFSFITG